MTLRRPSPSNRYITRHCHFNNHQSDRRQYCSSRRYNWACLSPIEIGEISRAVKHIINDSSSLHSRIRVFYFHFAVVKELMLFLHVDTQLKDFVENLILENVHRVIL